MLNMLSSNLKRNVRLVMCSSIGRAKREEWIPLRLEGITNVLKIYLLKISLSNISSRLKPNVKFVTYLFTFNCERCLQFSLDIAYLFERNDEEVGN